MFSQGNVSAPTLRYEQAHRNDLREFLKNYHAYKSSIELLSVDGETRVIPVKALIDCSFLELICEEQAPDKDPMEIAEDELIVWRMLQELGLRRRHRSRSLRYCY